MSASRGGVPGDRRPPTSGVCSGQFKGRGPVQHPTRGHVWPEPSASVGLPPSKRHRQVPTVSVSHLIAQETEAAALDLPIQELEKAHQNRGVLPYLSPSPKGVTYPL